MARYRGPDRPQNFSNDTFFITLAAGVAQTVGVPEGSNVVRVAGSDTSALYVSVDATIDTSPTATSGEQIATFDTITGATAIALQDYNFGFQNVSYTGTKVESDPTGLAADTAGYQLVDFAVPVSRGKPTGFIVTDDSTLDVVINVDAAGEQTEALRKGDHLDFQSVVNSINKKFLGVRASVVDDDIRVESKSVAVGSAIAINDTTSTLFLAMADYTAVESAVARTTTDYTVDVDRNGLAAPVTVTVNGDDAQTFGELATEIEADLTGITVTITGGDILLTSDLDTAASAIAITSDLLFSEVTDYSAIDSATAASQIDYIMNVDADGLGDILVSLNAGDFTTYTELAFDIDAAIAAKAACTVVGSTLETVSDLTGATSSIVITDTNLLSSLPEFLQLEASANGNLPQANFIQDPGDLNVKGASTVDIESPGTPNVTISFYR